MSFSFGGPPAQPAASSSFSFGGASTQNNQPATGTGSSLFGTSTGGLGQSTGGGLFGTKPAVPATGTGSGLFGSAQQPAQPTTSLFGAPAAQQNQQPQQSGGLFGSALGNNSVGLKESRRGLKIAHCMCEIPDLALRATTISATAATATTTAAAAATASDPAAIHPEQLHTGNPRSVEQPEQVQPLCQCIGIVRTQEEDAAGKAAEDRFWSDRPVCN